MLSLVPLHILEFLAAEHTKTEEESLCLKHEVEKCHQFFTFHCVFKKQVSEYISAEVRKER